MDLIELFFELDRTRAQLSKAEEELVSNRDDLELNQERIRELELNSSDGRARALANKDSSGAEEDEDGLANVSIISELDDALQKTTKTELVSFLSISKIRQVIDRFFLICGSLFRL